MTTSPFQTEPETPQISRKGVIEHIHESGEVRAAHYVVMIRRIIPKLLKKKGVKSTDVSVKALDRAMLSCAKDVEKMAIFQSDDIDEIKLSGYMAFWVRKIKPLFNATDEAGNNVNEINELLSVWIAEELALGAMVRMGKSAAEITATEDRFRHFYADTKYFEYVIHSMMVRTFGPHHFVIFLHKMMNGY